MVLFLLLNVLHFSCSKPLTVWNLFHEERSADEIRCVEVLIRAITIMMLLIVSVVSDKSSTIERLGILERIKLCSEIRSRLTRRC